MSDEIVPYGEEFSAIVRIFRIIDDVRAFRSISKERFDEARQDLIAAKRRNISRALCDQTREQLDMLNEVSLHVDSREGFRKARGERHVEVLASLLEDNLKKMLRELEGRN